MDLPGWLAFYVLVGVGYACWIFVQGNRDLDMQRVAITLGVDPVKGLIVAWFITLIVWPVLFLMDVDSNGPWKH